MTAAFIILLQMNAYSYINFNGAGNGYEPPGRSAVPTTNTLEYYIVESAGYYLAAGSDIQALLYMVELQDSRGLDFAAVNKSVDNAGIILAIWSSLIDL